MTKRQILRIVAVAFPAVLLVSGCSMSELLAENHTQTTYKSAKTSQEAVASGLLPDWVPEGGTEVKLEQRNSGHERIFVMDYAGSLPAESCTAISAVGEPSSEELAAAYQNDQRTKDIDPVDFADFRTLDAHWWPQGAEDRTTELCGRWWVHQADGQLFAFAADLSDMANQARTAKDTSQ